MASLAPSGTRPTRDFAWLSEYLTSARSYHADFIRQVDRTRLLFHYTDLNGLRSIATDHDLWLTHALYCNDEAEIRLGIEVARDQIKQLAAEAAAPKARARYLGLLDDTLSGHSESVYICCFCEQGDDLSQWRAYGADGNGVSIQIDPDAFVKYGGVHRYGFLALWNVFYLQNRQEQIMRAALENTYNRFKALPPAQIARKARDVIDFFVPTFKHHGFGGENEWRLIFVPSSEGPVKPRYRARRDMLIPYFSLKDIVEAAGPKAKPPKDWRLPIREVRIGPNRHRDLNCASAQSLLIDRGYQCLVLPSQTPYRS
jgi:hypothetical protein